MRERIASECENANVHICQMDVRSRESIDAVLKTLPEEFSVIDVLVNNAGLALGLDEVSAVSESDIDTVIDTNVKGVLHVTRAILPDMIKRGKLATIINIGSVAGVQAYPRASIYCASKHAVHAITQTLRMELIGTPIRVAEISPGKRSPHANASPVYYQELVISFAPIEERPAKCATPSKTMHMLTRKHLGLVETEFAKVRFNGDAEKASKFYQGLKPLAASDIGTGG